MPYLTNRGVQLYYEVHGHGTPLILSHGFSSTSDMWSGQISRLAQSFQLIIWDMRGHGQSAYPYDQSEYSESLTVSDMLALLDHVVGPGKQAIVGGLSLGGYMSLAFHRVHPSRVKALLIIDTGPGFKKDSAREAWNKTANDQALDFEANGLTRLRNLSPERANVQHRNARGLAFAARGMLAQRNSDVFYSLPSINVPSLVIVGELDKPFIAASEYMAAKITGAEKRVVPNAGHAANIDNPEGFMEALMPFLERVEGGAGGGKAKL